MSIASRCAVLLLTLASLLPGLVLASENRTVCPSPSAGDYFFPSGVLGPKAKGIDEFERQWYSEYLNAMSEPSLSCGSPTEAITYRFTWLRSFHHPIAVRVSMTSAGPTVTGIELEGASGYTPGAVKRRIEKPITAKQWKSLLASLKSARFWREPTQDSSGRGLDGAQWIFEGRDNGAYHVVDRWSPGSGPYHSLGRVFLDLAGFLPAADELY